MNTYEFTFITPTDKKTTMADIEKLLADHQADVKVKDTWGKRTLAYPIKKHNEGFYHLWTVALPSTAVVNLRKKLEISDDVIRYLLLKKS